MKNTECKSKLVIAAALVAMVGIPPGVAAEFPPDILRRDKPIGLRERIAQANTESELTMLMAEGKEYARASEKTRKSWKRTAIRRQVQLRLRGQS
jgi:hypothetical protein